MLIFVIKFSSSEPKLWKIWLSEVPESQLTCSEIKIKWPFSTAKLIFRKFFLFFFFSSFPLLENKSLNWMDHLLYQKEWVYLCQVSIPYISRGNVNRNRSHKIMSEQDTNQPDITQRRREECGLGRQSAYPLVHLLPTNPCIIHHKVAVGVNNFL